MCDKMIQKTEYDKMVKKTKEFCTVIELTVILYGIGMIIGYITRGSLEFGGETLFFALPVLYYASKGPAHEEKSNEIEVDKAA